MARTATTKSDPGKRSTTKAKATASTSAKFTGINKRTTTKTNAKKPAAAKPKATKSSATTTKTKAEEPATAKPKAAKSSATKKETGTTVKTKASASAALNKKGTKREAPTDEDDNVDRPTKKAKSTSTNVNKLIDAQKEKAPEPKKDEKPKLRRGKIINERPEQFLKVYVFGEGGLGELGLGSAREGRNVKIPRLNPYLSSESVQIVQLAAGGVHGVALSTEGVIYTWGVNDHGTLGRDTNEGDVYTEMKDGDSKQINGVSSTKNNGKNDTAGADISDEDSELDALNVLEATPHPISLKNVPEGTVFTSVAATDSCTLAITDDGYVFGCGTFRNNEGLLGYSQTVAVQKYLTHIPEISKVKQLACGSDHVIAVDDSGSVFSWGAGQQNQLGRRVLEHRQESGLRPSGVGVPKRQFVSIGAGAYSSFAIDKKARVWAWGLNSFGELGIPDGIEDETASSCLLPEVVPALSGLAVSQISGGAHHTLALCANGKLLGVGRVDGYQLGGEGSSFADADTIKDFRGRARIVKVPTQIPNLPEEVSYASAGPDHCLAAMKDGKAYSWGFSANFQTGQGTDDDVEQPMSMHSGSFFFSEQIVWCGAGGQYGMVATKPGVI